MSERKKNDISPPGALEGRLQPGFFTASNPLLDARRMAVQTLYFRGEQQKPDFMSFTIKNMLFSWQEKGITTYAETSQTTPAAQCVPSTSNHMLSRFQKSSSCQDPWSVDNVLKAALIIQKAKQNCHLAAQLHCFCFNIIAYKRLHCCKCISPAECHDHRPPPAQHQTDKRRLKQHLAADHQQEPSHRTQLHRV